MPSIVQRSAGALRQFVDLEKASLDAAMRAAAPCARGRLLDVGCGDKPYEPLFRPHVTEYVGAEYEATYAPSANERKGKADVLYSGEVLPFPDGAFETVLSNQVGEHVPDPRVFFAELVRVLAVGGRLIVTVPFSYRIHSEPYDFHRFTRYALERYAADNHLAVELLAARGGFWSVIGQKLTSHLALRYGRLAGQVQRLGGFGYLEPARTGPRYWALPVVAPAVVGVAAVARLLDRLDHDESDTIGYLLVATKA